MKRLSLIFTLLLLLGLPHQAHAQNVSVTLPTFAIELNGSVIDNNYRQYPFLYYKNITYLPMTYYDCRFLGLESNYNEQTGLSINQTDITAGLRHYRSATANGRNYTAATADFPITLNGVKIDNAKEPYPLLTFRGVTYFPLTFHFAAESFGWNYEFDTVNNRLLINSANYRLKEIDHITDFKTESGLLLSGNNLYYNDHNGHICQMALNGPKKSKIIHQFERSSYGDNYPSVAFTEDDGHRYFSYHVGGAIMGHDKQYEILADDTLRILKQRYGAVKDFDSILVEISHQVPPSPSLIDITENGVKRSVGESNYYYAALLTKDNSAIGYSGNHTIYLKNRDLYLLAANDKVSITDENLQSCVYTVNIDSGKTTALCHLACDYFQMTDKNVFMRQNHQLYGLDLASQKITTMASLSRSNDTIPFLTIGNQLYYLDESDKLYRFPQTTPLNNGAVVKRLNENNGCLVVEFEEKPEVAVRLLVIDDQGTTILQSADVITAISVDTLNKQLVYVADGAVYYHEYH